MYENHKIMYELVINKLNTLKSCCYSISTSETSSTWIKRHISLLRSWWLKCDPCLKRAMVQNLKSLLTSAFSTNTTRSPYSYCTWLPITHSVMTLKKKRCISITWLLHSRCILYICVSVSISVSEREKKWREPLQHRMQCDSPHICCGSWSAAAQSHMAQSTWQLCYWLSNQRCT